MQGPIGQEEHYSASASGSYQESGFSFGGLSIAGGASSFQGLAARAMKWTVLLKDAWTFVIFRALRCLPSTYEGH